MKKIILLLVLLSAQALFSAAALELRDKELGYFINFSFKDDIDTGKIGKVDKTIVVDVLFFEKHKKCENITAFFIEQPNATKCVSIRYSEQPILFDQLRREFRKAGKDSELMVKILKEHNITELLLAKINARAE